jgi:hypothetical protein
MRKSTRFVARGLWGMLLVLLLPGSTGAPVSADGRVCARKRHDAQVCVDVNSLAPKRVFGSVFNSRGTLFAVVTVFVKQCRVDITHCVTVAANRQTSGIYIETSLKPASAGHVYQACAS